MMNDDRQLALWCDAFAERLGAQISLSDLIAEQIEVELRLLAPEVRLTESLGRALFQAVLQRSQALDSAQAWHEQVAESAREPVEWVIEGIGGRLAAVYDDYLRRHWGLHVGDLPDAAAFEARVQVLLGDHVARLQALLAQGDEVEVLMVEIEAYQQRWHGQDPSQALAGD